MELINERRICRPTGLGKATLFRLHQLESEFAERDPSSWSGAKRVSRRRVRIIVESLRVRLIIPHANDQI